MQFDHFLFVVQEEAVTVYLNGSRQSTHPHGIIDLTLERESLVHMGRVEGSYQLPELADQIPDEAWLQGVEQIDHLKPEVVSSERHTLYPSAPLQD